jgi:hypothetical protein
MDDDDDDCESIGGTLVPAENLPQCRFVCHRSPMTGPGLEPGPPRWGARDCLSYDTAQPAVNW